MRDAPRRNAGNVTTLDAFETRGFVLIPAVLSPDECEALGGRYRSGTGYGSGGTRRLLREDRCADLARRLSGHPALSRLIPPTHVAIRCTSFEKSAARNWLVPIHQDLSIPVAERVEGEELRGWSEKEGSLLVQGPADLLEPPQLRPRPGPASIRPPVVLRGLMCPRGPWARPRRHSLARRSRRGYKGM
jgi:hypothetical protein